MRLPNPPMWEKSSQGPRCPGWRRRCVWEVQMRLSCAQAPYMPKSHRTRHSNSLPDPIDPSGVFSYLVVKGFWVVYRVAAHAAPKDRRTASSPSFARGQNGKPGREPGPMGYNGTPEAGSIVLDLWRRDHRSVMQ